MKTNNLKVENFMQQVKIKAEMKAKQMAKLELSCWDERHEAELKEHFGFTDITLKERKKELEQYTAA